jgi:hypothetical protein
LIFEVRESIAPDYSVNFRASALLYLGVKSHGKKEGLQGSRNLRVRPSATLMFDDPMVIREMSQYRHHPHIAPRYTI